MDMAAETDARRAGLLAFDLDGTVFGDHVTEELSPRVRSAFEELHRRGWVLCAASGRARQELGDGIVNTPWIEWQLCCNGAALFRHGDEEPVISHLMTIEQGHEIRKMLGDLPIRFWVHTVAGMFIDHWLSDDEGSDLILKGPCQVDDPLTAPGVEKGLYKVMAHFSTEGNRIEAERLLSPHSDVYEIINQGPTTLEFTLKGVSKGSTALDLCLREGIDPAASVGIGDSGNDMSFTETPMTFVAMESAEQKVLDVADYVCPDVEHDGVAVWIEEHLLG